MPAPGSQCYSSLHVYLCCSTLYPPIYYPIHVTYTSAGSYRFGVIVMRGRFMRFKLSNISQYAVD